MDEQEKWTTADVFDRVRAHLTLSRAEGTISTTEVADLLEVVPATASHHLKALVAEGLLVKAPPPHARDFMLAEPTALEAALVKRFLKPTTLDEAREQKAKGEPSLDEDRLKRLSGLGLVALFDAKAKGPSRWRATQAGFALVAHCIVCAKPYGNTALLSSRVENVRVPHDYDTAYVSAMHLTCVSRKEGADHKSLRCNACGISLHRAWIDLPAVSWQEVRHAFDELEWTILFRFWSHDAAISNDEESLPAASSLDGLTPLEILALLRNVDRVKSVPATKALRAAINGDLADLPTCQRLVAYMAAASEELRGQTLDFMDGGMIQVFAQRPIKPSDDESQIIVTGQGQPRFLNLSEAPRHIQNKVAEFRRLRDADFTAASCHERALRIWREANAIRRFRTERIEVAFDQLAGPAGAYYRHQREWPGGKQTLAFFGSPPRTEHPAAIAEHRDGFWYHPGCAPSTVAPGQRQAAASQSQGQSPKDLQVQGQEKRKP